MDSSPERLRITRRHLPHWSLAGVTYFVTFRLRAKPLSRAEISLVKQHLLFGHTRYYKLLAAQVMPDHVHLILRPHPPFSLSRILKGIKGATARKLNRRRRRRGSLWQDESFDRIIRSEKEFREILDYMFRNPVSTGLAADPLSYVGWYLNGEEVR